MEKIIALLFLDRNLTHLEHLRTSSYAQHMALGSFYEDIIELADKLAEAYQGLSGVMRGITILHEQPVKSIDQVLWDHMLEIQKFRKEVNFTALQNILDEVVGLYLSTIYKLRNLH